MSTLRVLTVAGTRPELIRLSRLIPLLDKISVHHFAYTGQNFDINLRDVFFRDLGLRQPDSEFNVNTESFGSTMADTIVKTEALIQQFNPNAVIILGDTNSAIAAIPAERMGVPVYHLEAGNRSFDANVPEELNRRLVDHISTFNLPYTEHARRNLLREGVPERRIFLSGSPIAEVLAYYEKDIQDSKILDALGLSSDGYILASLHRQENVDSHTRLREILEALRAAASEFGKPVIVSTHPRTRNKMQELGIGEIPGLVFAEPFGYFDYMKLQLAASCVVSDSGTISEESAIAGFPSVTLRDSMERPEALETGSAIMSTSDQQSLIEAINFATSRPKSRSIPEDYAITDFSQRVASVIISTAKLAPTWLNLKTRD